MSKAKGNIKLCKESAKIYSYSSVNSSGKIAVRNRDRALCKSVGLALIISFQLLNERLSQEIKNNIPSWLIYYTELVKR